MESDTSLDERQDGGMSESSRHLAIFTLTRKTDAARVFKNGLKTTFSFDSFKIMLITTFSELIQKAAF